MVEMSTVPVQGDGTQFWLEGIATILDSLDAPAWVIDPMGRRVHCSSKGNSSLDRVLRVDPTSQSKVQPVDDDQVFAWHNALTRVQSKGFASISLDNGSEPFVIRMRLLEFTKRTRRQDVLIVIYGRREKCCNDEMLHAYSKANSLTESEFQILELLINNVAPAKIAERRNVSEWTVRAQIKSVLNKTHTHSMRDLMLAVSMLPPII